MRITLIIALLIVTLLNSWAQSPTQDILLFRDKDGLYLYTFSTGKEKLLFKANEQQVFLDEPYKLLNNVLTFGFTGTVTEVRSGYSSLSGYKSTEKYYKDYYSVDLTTGKSWHSGKVLYSLIGDKLTIKTKAISPKGDTTIAKKDSTVTVYSTSNSTRGVTYNNTKPPFYSENKSGDKTVLSKKGSIYFADKKDTTLLVKNNRLFDPINGTGYIEPQIAPGDYIICRYLPGTAYVGERQSLQKIDVKTKKASLIKEGLFSDISLSKDSKFLLFIRRDTESSIYKPTYSAYILNLSTLQEKKLGKASFAEWMQ